jgi:SNF2 family DNA or RNA helicase
MGELEDRIAKIQAELAELQAQKAEQERIEAAKPVTINVLAFSKATGRVNFRLSKYDPKIVNQIRFYLSRTWVEAFQTNTLLFKDWEAFTQWLQHNSNAVIEYAINVEDALNWYREQPDVKVVLGDKSKLRVTLGPAAAGQRMQLAWNFPMSYFSEGNYYTIPLSEAYKLPEQLELYYPKWKIEYDEESKKAIFDQLERQKLLATVATATDAPDIESPFCDSIFAYKPHQRVAAKFLRLVKFKGIVGYDMGLGKSPIAIGESEADPECTKVLIICPSNLRYNWQREIKKFACKDAVILSGTDPDTSALNALMDKNTKYYIINYDAIARSIVSETEKDGKENHASKWILIFNHFRPGGFDKVWVDEAHYIKNLPSKRSVAVRQIEAKAVIPMTGTPLVNRKDELFALLNVVDKETFNNFAQFSNFTTRQVTDILSRYMIRRSFKDVYTDLSEPNRIPIQKQLSSEAQRKYDRIMEEGVYESLRRPDYQKDVTGVLAQLMRCKQVCSADNCETSVELALEAIENTEKKVLIFSQFLESHAAIKAGLGHECEAINGSIADSARYEVVDRFQDAKSTTRVVVTNILEGLTLTEAHTVIINDLWWTPKDHRQAEGRAFGRTNDPHSGNSYYLVNEGTIDDFIWNLLKDKLALFEAVIDGVPQTQEDQGSIISALIKHLRGKL